MGTRRRRQRQEKMWIAQQELAKGPAHPFYQRVNELLEEKKFDEFAEKDCAKFYAEKMGRPSLAPGIYFRLLLVGYFEGIDSERGIAWRAADSLGLRKSKGEAFGDAKLEQVLLVAQMRPPSELMVKLLDEICAWQPASMAQQDDITLIVIDVL
jgi:transposase-like protein DUF772